MHSQSFLTPLHFSFSPHLCLSIQFTTQIIQIKNSPISIHHPYPIKKTQKKVRECIGIIIHIHSFTFTLVPILSSRLVIPPYRQEYSPISTRPIFISVSLVLSYKETQKKVREYIGTIIHSHSFPFSPHN